jgi:hypothetical protein
MDKPKRAEHADIGTNILFLHSSTLPDHQFFTCFIEEHVIHIPIAGGSQTPTSRLSEASRIGIVDQKGNNIYSFIHSVIRGTTRGVISVTTQVSRNHLDTIYKRKTLIGRGIDGKSIVPLTTLEFRLLNQSEAHAANDCNTHSNEWW